MIDLSADYRLKDAIDVCRMVRPRTIPTPAGLREAVYGLPELYPSTGSVAASLIANPGCYTSASILGLAPLVAHDLIERSGIVIDAKSGDLRRGAVAQAEPALSPSATSRVSAYSVGTAPPHPRDRRRCFRRGRPGPLADEPVEVIFTPHLMPMDRGILATIYANAQENVAG